MRIRKKKVRRELEKLEFEHAKLLLRQLKRRYRMHKEAMRLEKKSKVSYVT